MCKRFIFFAALIFLSACSSSTPLQIPRPPAPANLAHKAPKLPPLADGANMGDLLKDDAKTKQKYNELRARHNALVDWANSQL